RSRAADFGNKSRLDAVFDVSEALMASGSATCPRPFPPDQTSRATRVPLLRNRWSFQRMMRGRVPRGTSCSMYWDSGRPAQFSRWRQFWLISRYFEPEVETGLRARGRFSEPCHKPTLSKRRSQAGRFRADLHSWRVWSRSLSSAWPSLSSSALPRSRRRCGRSQLPPQPDHTLRSDFPVVCPPRTTLVDSPVMMSSHDG